jgi:hypothetical protein
MISTLYLPSLKMESKGQVFAVSDSLMCGVLRFFIEGGVAAWSVKLRLNSVPGNWSFFISNDNTLFSKEDYYGQGFNFLCFRSIGTRSGR